MLSLIHILLASFQRQQSLCVAAALAGALGGILLFSIPAAILAGIVCGCLTALCLLYTSGDDISCNLGSLNIAHTMDSPDCGRTIATAVRALTAVSDMSDIQSVPSVAAGNAASHAIGLGRCV